MSFTRSLTYPDPTSPPAFHDAPSPIPVLACVFGAAALGFAIHLHGGEFTPRALHLVSASLAAVLVAALLYKRNVVSRHDAFWHGIALTSAFTIALSLQFFALFVTWPVGPDQGADEQSVLQHQLYLYLVGAAGFIVLVGFLKVPSMRVLWFPVLLLLHSMLGFWTVRVSPIGSIDVWRFQQRAAQVWLEGRNPYDAKQIRYVDEYHSTEPGGRPVYGPGLVVNDHLTFGFPYPPLTLYGTTLSYKLTGDIRYADAVALTLAGLLIGYCRPGRLPKMAATLFLFTPTEWFVLGRSWTEPLVVMCLAATVFCAFHNLRRLLPVALGLLLSSKQYLVLAVPLTCLLIPAFDVRSKASWREWLVLLLGAGLMAAAVTLPMALLDFRAYWFSTITVQQLAPFREDALSYLNWLAINKDPKYATREWLAFAALIPAYAIVLWKSRRGAGAFALSVSLIYLVFISLNKQAFCNYYFFVVGCLCCAIAAMPVRLPAARSYHPVHPR